MQNWRGNDGIVRIDFIRHASFLQGWIPCIRLTLRLHLEHLPPSFSISTLLFYTNLAWRSFSANFPGIPVRRKLRVPIANRCIVKFFKNFKFLRYWLDDIWVIVTFNQIYLLKSFSKIIVQVMIQRKREQVRSNKDASKGRE